GIVGKLPWKVEWAAKWKAIGVTVEGAGKDHMSKGGSHDLASEVCKRVLNYEVPYPIAYEWFLVGGRKMSSSRGVGSSAAETLEILPPELLRFLMVKTNIREAINFDPSGDTIPRLFDEYQEYADHYFGNKKDDYARIFELSQVGNIKKPPKVRFSILAQWIQMPDVRDKIEKEKLEQWVPYVQIWLDRYAPESERFVVQKEVPKNARNLSSSQKEYLKKVSELIGQNLSAEILQARIYELAKELGISPKAAFGAVYIALLGKDHGPKAAWLISSLDRDFVKERFSSL
ncbi:MAG: lysine--tRNA ligase, partial [Patescibacteria group bacterium]